MDLSYNDIWPLNISNDVTLIDGLWLIEYGWYDGSYSTYREEVDLKYFYLKTIINAFGNKWMYIGLKICEWFYVEPLFWVLTLI